MTATDTEAALLAAVRANPGEDAPRLVLADWLEENAGTVQRCSGTHLHDGEKFPLISGGFAWDAHGVIHRANPKQPHHHCDEKCRVSDGRAELAEFVRVQVELAAEHSDCGAKGYGPCGKRCEELRARERELWPAVRGTFEGEGAVPALSGSAFANDEASSPGNAFVIVRRGLPAVVRCTLAEWMGGIQIDYSAPPSHAGIFPITPGIGPRLAQRWPIERVETCREPLRHAYKTNEAYLWWNYNGPSGHEFSDLPDEIFSMLDDGDILTSQSRTYPTEPAARADLSDALIAWARGQEIEEKR